MAELMDKEADSAALPIREKQPKQQLTKGMEHMRSYVTISDPDSTPPTTNGDLGEDTYGVPASYEPIRKEVKGERNENAQRRNDPFQFGTRYLTSDDDIFAFNAWDHVEVDPQYQDFIQEQATFQRENQVSDFDKQRFNSQPEKWWDKFYSNNATNFFKDRKWLVQEFPGLGEVTKAEYGPVTVLEVGAGAGNTAFPLLAMNTNPDLRLWACDYSRKAVKLIQSQSAYMEQGEPKVLQADVWDAASTCLPLGLAADSVDLVLMVFIFSALSPEQWQQAVKNVWQLLRPGGEVLFRDYGRGDLAQVRFKKGRYLEENFYVRGDGTRVYFFEQEELRRIWTGEAGSAIQRNDVVPLDAAGERGDKAQMNGDAGMGAPESTTVLGSKTELAGCDETASAADTGESKGTTRVNGAPSPVSHTQDEKSSARFEVTDLATDRRMLVNRQRKLKMYRCWLQGRFRKPDGTAPASDFPSNVWLGTRPYQVL